MGYIRRVWTVFWNGGKASNATKEINGREVRDSVVVAAILWGRRRGAVTALYVRRVPGGRAGNCSFVGPCLVIVLWRDCAYLGARRRGLYKNNGIADICEVARADGSGSGSDANNKGQMMEQVNEVVAVVVVAAWFFAI